MAIDVRNLQITSGTLNAGNNAVAISTNLVVGASGAFNAGASGTLTFDGGGHSTATIDGGATTSINDVVLAKTDNRMNLTVNGTLNVGGSLTIAGINRINTGTIDVAGDVITTDTSVGGTAVILLDGSHNISGGGRLSVLNVAGGTTTASSDFGVRSLIVTGTLDASDDEVSITNNLTINSSGDFSGSLKFDGGSHSYATVDGSATTAVEDLTLAKSDNRMHLTVNGTLNVGGDLRITGINQIKTGTIDVAGDVITTDTSVGGTAVILLDGSHNISGGGRLSVLNVAGGTTTASSDFGVRSLIVTGTLDASDDEVSITNNLTINSSGDFSGSLKFDGGSHSYATVDGSATTAVEDLTLAKSDDRMLFNLTGTLDVGGNLTITETNQMQGGTIKVAGDVLTTDTSVGGSTTILLNGSHTVTGVGALPDLEVVNGTTTLVNDVDTRSVRVLGGGVLKADGSATLGIGRDFTVDGGTFTHNNGTVSFNQASHSIVDIGSTQLYNLGLDKTDNRMYLTIVGPALDVNGNLEILGINTLRGTAQINVARDVSTSDTSVGNGLIVMDGKKIHQGLIATVAGAQVPNLTIAKTDSRFDVNVTGTVTVNGDLTVTQVQNINGGTINVVDDVHTTDNAVGGSGTVRLNGAHVITTDANGGELPNLLIAGGTTNASSPSYLGVQDMTVTSGTFLAPTPGTLGIADDFTVSGGTFTAGSGTVTLNGKKTHQVIDIGGASLHNLTIAKTDSRFNVTIVGTVEVTNDLTVTQVNNINGGTINVGGDVHTTDDAVGGSATVRLNGSHAITTDANGGELPNLLIDGGTTDATSPSYLGVQDMTVTSGTFLAPTPGTLGIAESFTISGGTFDAGTGTVNMNGSSSVKVIDIGSTSLNDLTISISNSYPLNLVGSVDVNGDLLITSVQSINDGTFNLAGNLTVNDSNVKGDVKYVLDGTGPVQTIFAAAAGSLNKAAIEILDNKLGFDAILLSDVTVLDLIFASMGVDGGATLDLNGHTLTDLTP